MARNDMEIIDRILASKRYLCVEVFGSYVCMCVKTGEVLTYEEEPSDSQFFTTSKAALANYYRATGQWPPGTNLIEESSIIEKDDGVLNFNL